MIDRLLFSCLSRRGSKPVSTVLRKSVRFFITNIFLIIIVELSKLKSGNMVCTNVFFFQFPGIRQKPGKGSFRKLKPKKIPGGASGLP